MRFLILAALLATIAFGVNWMAYEQYRSNTIQFVPYGTVGPKA
jgi:hypothetical protein